MFDRWWRARGRRHGDFQAPPLRQPDGNETEGDTAAGRRRRAAATTVSSRPDEWGVPIPADGDDDENGEDIEGIVVAPDAYSRGEMLKHREFDRMTPAELRDAERLVDELVPRLEQRRTRRYELHSHGRRLAPRAMFRRNLGTGGQLMSWVWRRPCESRARSS